MQIQTGDILGNTRCAVVQNSQVVTAAVGSDWSRALPGSWFTVKGSGLSYDIGAVEFSGGLWRVTLTGDYINVSNPTAEYVIHKDFGPNGEPIFAVGDNEILTLLNRWTRAIADAVAGEKRTIIVDTIADLQAVMPLPGLSVFARGRNVVGDGGGGLFVYSNGAEQTDGGTVFAYNGDLSAPATAARTPANLNGYIVAAGNLAFGSVDFTLSNGIVIPDLLLHGHRMNSGGVLCVPRINHKTGLITDTNDVIKSNAGAAGVTTITINYRTIGNSRRWVRPASDALLVSWFNGDPSADANVGNGGNWVAWALHSAARLGRKIVDLAGKTVRYYGPIEIPNDTMIRNGKLKVRDGSGADNVLKYLRADYVKGPDAYVQLDLGPGLYSQDGAAVIRLRDLEIDGNYLTNDDPMVNPGNYPGGGGPGNALQNSPVWVGLSTSNHSGRVISNLRVEVDNIHIHHVGSTGILGNQSAWYVGNNVRIGHVLRNHQYYRADGIWTDLELYGCCWGTMMKLRHGEFHGLRFYNLEDNPYIPTDNPILVNFEGFDYGTNAFLGSGQEEDTGAFIDGLIVDFGTKTRGGAFVQGIGKNLRVVNGVLTGSKVIANTLFNYLGNGAETGIGGGWTFEKIMLMQRGFEWAIGGGAAVYADSVSLIDVQIQNVIGYNNPVAANPVPHILQLASNVRTDPASQMPLNISINRMLRRYQSPSAANYVADFNCLNASGGKVKLSIKDSEVACLSSAVIKGPNGQGTLAGLTVQDATKLDILWENSIIPDNGENAFWSNFELYIRCSRFRNCTTPQGYKTEDFGSVAFTAAGGETTYDIQTALLWVPRHAGLVRLVAKNAVTAAALANAWLNFRHRSSATDIVWGTFTAAHPAGDYRNPKVRINFATPLTAGQAISFDWSAAVAP